MKYSAMFGKTTRNVPKDEVTANADLLTRAGFVEKLMAGAYTYLPLGLKVLNNIAAIVRAEMDAIGGQELLMPMLHPKERWVTTGAWDSVDVLFKVRSRTDREYALGQSEEEAVDDGDDGRLGGLRAGRRGTPRLADACGGGRLRRGLRGQHGAPLPRHDP